MPTTMTEVDRASTTGSSRRRVAVALALAMAAAAAMRLASAGQVFKPSGVELTGDDDPLYHVLRAERMARGAPGAPWFDPALNYPYGSYILWPPLFDALIAGGARLASPAEVPPRSVFVLVTALLPVLIAIATVPVVRSLAAALLGGEGLAAAWIFALLPAHAMFSRIGRGDQHVLELLVASSIFLVVARGLKEPDAPRLWPVAALTAAFVAAFWTWMGSALYLLLLVGFAGAWFVWAGGSDRAARRLLDDLRDGAALGTVLLALSILATRGTSGLMMLSVSGVTGFHVAELLLVAVFAAALSGAVRRAEASVSAARRMAVAAGAALLPLGLLGLSGSFRDSVGSGLAALGQANAWYRSIEEFDPLLFAGFDPWQRELAAVVAMYGIALAVMPVAAWAIARRLRTDAARRAPLAFALFWGIAMLVLAFARKRFALYLSVPLALWAGLVVEEASSRASGMLRRPWTRTPIAVGIVSCLLAPAILGFGRTFAPEEPAHAALRLLLERLPADAISSDRPAVMADWGAGHLVQYASGRPVVVSPFGLDGGAGAMEDNAAFFLARDPAPAEELLSRRRVGVVVLGDPAGDVYFAQAFAPPGAVEPVSLTRSIRGYQARVKPAFRELIVVRLWSEDGAANEHGPALGGFRLVDEIIPVGMAGRPRPYKVFGVVPGCTLRVRTSSPGSVVRVLVNLVTNAGREIPWSTWAVASEACEAVVRIPYETGVNGHVTASPALVSDGTRVEPVVVSREAVLAGREVEVAMGGGCGGAAVDGGGQK